MIKLARSKFQQLLQSRKEAEERTRLHEIGEKLRRRLGRVLKAEAQPERQKLARPNAGNTEKFDRILVLWLDLQKAFTKARNDGQSKAESQQVPWSCEDKEVSRLWEQITRPGNSSALAEWLYQSATGEQEIWAQQALTECWLRAGEKKT